MELTKQIYDLIEPEEKERLIRTKSEDAVIERIDRFVENVVLVAYRDMEKEFEKFGRLAHIFPPISCARTKVFPTFNIPTPDGGTFRYSLKIMNKSGNFLVERHLSIEERGRLPKLSMAMFPLGRQFVDILSEVRKEDIQRDIIELYQRYILKNTNPLRHAQ